MIETLGGATKADLEAAIREARDNEQTAGIVPGTVTAFDLPNGCPSGWVSLPNAAGRYIVGLLSDGVLGKTVGTALNDGENRAVGKHIHGMADNGDHSHSLAKIKGIGGTHGAAAASKVGDDALPVTGKHRHTVTAAGDSDGTDAPYIQLLICKKA